MSWQVKVTAGGWLFKLDPHGLALVHVDRYAASLIDDLAAGDAGEDDGGHCCECSHPDAACEHDVELAFREDDLGDLMHRVWNRLIDPQAAMAELVAGVRAEPRDDDDT